MGFLQDMSGTQPDKPRLLTQAHHTATGRPAGLLAHTNPIVPKVAQTNLACDQTRLAIWDPAYITLGSQGGHSAKKNNYRKFSIKGVGRGGKVWGALSLDL